MKRGHTCYGSYDGPGPARRIGQQDASAHTGDDTAMTTASGPLIIGGAQVLCPLCSSPLVSSEQPPATAGGTVLNVHRCPSCPWVMVGADIARRTIDADALERLAYRQEERMRLEVRYADPARFVTGTSSTIDRAAP